MHFLKLFFSQYALFKYSKHINSKNANWFKEHFFCTKYNFQCIKALKNPIYKDLLSSLDSLCKCCQFQMCCHTLFLTYWAKLGSIGGSFSLLEPIANCGVATKVESSIFVISFFESITASFEYGGELSFST